MGCWPSFALLVGLCACSTFSESPGDGGVDAASDSSVPSGDADAGPADDAGRDGTTSGDAGSPDGCAVFGVGQSPPAGWAFDAYQTNLTEVIIDNRTCMEALVTGNGQRSAATRDLTIPSNGQLTVTVDLQVSAADSAVIGWRVDLVTVACATPKMQFSLELGPGALLTAEAVPRGTLPPVALGPANIDGLTTLQLQITGANINVLYRGIAGLVDFPSPITAAKGCTLTVGAIATGNVPRSTADIAGACVMTP